jgi:hypothetical protein
MRPSVLSQSQYARDPWLGEIPSVAERGRILFAQGGLHAELFPDCGAKNVGRVERPEGIFRAPSLFEARENPTTMRNCTSAAAGSLRDDNRRLGRSARSVLRVKCMRTAVLFR